MVLENSLSAETVKYLNTSANEDGLAAEVETDKVVSLVFTDPGILFMTSGNLH